MSEQATRILFVDDEPNILKALRRALIEEPYEVLLAESGSEGLERLSQEENISVVVSDQRMPGMTGVAFLEQVKERFPETVRLLLTGYADVGAAMDCVNRAGASRYLTKPWDDDDLRQVLADLVRRQQLEAENRRLQETIRQKNEELKAWNDKLKSRVLEQTSSISKKNEELSLLNRNIRENFQNAILAFSNLIELNDESMLCHGRNCAELAVSMATRLGLEEELVENLRVAALLHDIGKIGDKTQIALRNFSEMSTEEQDAYQRHPVRGQAAIDVVKGLREAGVLIRHHHERFDGQGFPDALRGNAIPLGARILAVADALENAVRQDPAAEPMGTVARCLEEGRGKLFDPGLLEAAKGGALQLWGGGKSCKGWVKKEYHPTDLRTGMVLLSDLRSGTGLLLLKKGTTLDAERLNSIHRFYELDPGLLSIPVLVEDNV